jgi:radical SAM protein with 4Fe4S-binding SPASM domain
MRDTPQTAVFMTMEEFEESLDFLERSGVEYVSLLGGEPTIHPQFAEMTDRAIARGFHVLVLSGGLIPERIMKKLEAISKDKISVMMNIAPPGGEFSRREQERQKEVMVRLGSKVVLGLNIDSPRLSLEFLLHWINEYQLARTVRLGLAHPIVGGNNAYLAPRDYSAVGRRVANFAFLARDADVRIEFDCGWVPCMFPDGTLEDLGIGPQQVGLRCNPILDILPGGQVISCYPLAALARETLPAEHDGAWLSDSFNERLGSYRPMMLFRECATCAWRQRGECTGGCIANAMRRMQSPVQITRIQSPPVQLRRSI